MQSLEKAWLTILAHWKGMRVRSINSERNAYFHRHFSFTDLYTNRILINLSIQFCIKIVIQEKLLIDSFDDEFNLNKCNFIFRIAATYRND